MLCSRRCFICQARELAQRLRVLCQIAHVDDPGLEAAARDLGLESVVEHDAQAGVALAQLQEATCMAWVAKGIEAQVQFLQGREGPGEISAQDPVIVRQVLHHRRKATPCEVHTASQSQRPFAGCPLAPGRS